MRASGMRTSGRRWTGRGAAVAVAAVAASLLLTMGGAIVAAPITVPLLALMARERRSSGYRAVAAVVAGLTVAEVAWALAYLAAGEAQPWIWLVPLVLGVAGFGGVWRAGYVPQT
jgi:hypothetical protein